MVTLALVNGDLSLTTISDATALKQRITNRLSLYLGEFSLAPSAGVDWFSVSKGTDSEFIKNLIIKELRKEEYITSINFVDVTVVSDAKTSRELLKPLRTAIVNYSVNTIYGTLEGNL